MITVLSALSAATFVLWYRRYSERHARRAYAAYFRWIHGRPE